MRNQVLGVWHAPKTNSNVILSDEYMHKEKPAVLESRKARGPLPWEEGFGGGSLPASQDGRGLGSTSSLLLAMQL